MRVFLFTILAIFGLFIFQTNERGRILMSLSESFQDVASSYKAPLRNISEKDDTTIVLVVVGGALFFLLVMRGMFSNWHHEREYNGLLAVLEENNRDHLFRDVSNSFHSSYAIILRIFVIGLVLFGMGWLAFGTDFISQFSLTTLIIAGVIFFLVAVSLLGIVSRDMRHFWPKIIGRVAKYEAERNFFSRNRGRNPEEEG
ncbi:MAG TPA: hypothetical protein DCL54_12030 [Alphaproteobacteria bacterium]|nr:hypothetical protein [Alphaproteobacteria bacterium]HAJ47296.1 hypothetical protein [Alphaproteobacteria bacterium]